MSTVYVGEKLHRLEVSSAGPVAGFTRPDYWRVVAFREDARGCFTRTTYYPDRPAAITAAQRIRTEENPRAGLAVYCPVCHARQAHLFGYWVCACAERSR